VLYTYDMNLFVPDLYSDTVGMLASIRLIGMIIDE
jgi:hypothetical protein